MPQKLGQHFLRDASILRRIAAALDVQPNDTVIEIGPGHGELTDNIVSLRPARLILIEKDPALTDGLREKYADLSSVSIYRGDARRALAEVVEKEMPIGGSYKVIGNIPYYLTGFLLRILGGLDRKPSMVVLTMQEEVAERLAAMPPHMNKLAASVQFWADPEILMTISAGAFQPPPDVSSAALRLTPKKPPMDAEAYFSFVRRLFAHPRKTVANNLYIKDAPDAEKVKIHAELDSLGIAADARAQQLSIETIVALAKTLGA